MSVFIAPAVSVVTGLLNQSATIRAKKLASDIANAQAANGLWDQSYLMVVQRTPQQPPTRYEWDNAIRPYTAAINNGDVATLRATGLFSDAMLAWVASQHPTANAPMTSQTMPVQSLPAPAGATSQAPKSTGLPDWLLPAGLVGAMALFILGHKRR